MLNNIIDGSGTERNPYQITNVKELQSVNQDLSAYYVLANDIDATETKEWDDRRGFEPIGNRDDEFVGTFDGNNHEIRNLYIEKSHRRAVGLFGGNDGLIKNVKLTNATVKGRRGVGSLVGYNMGKIESSHSVSGDITGFNVMIGGLVGVNDGKIEDSYSTKNVTVRGGNKVGGIVGYNTGKIESSYSMLGDVTGDIWVGGLVGHNSGTIDSSYAMVDFTGDNCVGGLVGASSTRISSEVSGCWCVGHPVIEDSDAENLNYVFSFSTSDEYKNPETPDLLISKSLWKISYDMNSKYLYLVVAGENYSCSGVSPIEAQGLAEAFEDDFEEMSNDFREFVATDS